ncbi:MAG: hypothetical protein U9N31_07745 [Candidatus Marinimicrobia bacterium]|nr:hypothetical protein [Candidatus Neomarinimicrobiota bacterium]
MNYLKKNPQMLTWISMGAFIAMFGKYMDLSFGELVVFGTIFGVYSGSLIGSTKKETQQ